MYRLAFVGLIALAACGETASPTPTGGSASHTVSTGTAAVSGQSETVLVDGSGKTLYYKTDDSATTSSCTGGCASAWPPLITTKSSLSEDTSVAGTLTVVTDANGSQVQYNGHFLYTYAGDSGAGQATGEGVGGIWHAATVGLASVGSGSTPTAQPQSSSSAPAYGAY